MTRRLPTFVGGALPAILLAATMCPAWAQAVPNPALTNLDAGAPGDAGTEGDGGAPVERGVEAVPLAAPAPKVEVQTQLEPGADRETGIRGRVFDARTKQPLVDAPVIAKADGKTRTTLTDERGGFRLFLPPGIYSLISYYDLYHGARIQNARVTRGKLLPLDLMLAPLDESEDVAIEEMEVTYRADTTSAAAQDQLRLASSNIGEGFGSKQMAQVGASDAGGAASRVVGVQVEGNQLVVRGLGGRYTRVLLNGVPVPSTDPDLPGADLDLFPTNVIDSLNVSKAFLPSNVANFAGGLMEIKSVNFPREPVFSLGLSLGANSLTTFRDTPTYKGGKYDFLGFDDGKRQLPDAIPTNEPVNVSRNGRYKTFDSVYEATRAFPNRWQYRYTSGLPKLGVDASVGNSHNFGNRSRIGYLATASYDYELIRRTGISRPRPSVTSDGRLITFNDFKLESGTEEVSINTFATVSADLGPDNTVSALSLYNRSMTDETQVQKGISGEIAVDGPIEKWQLQFLARSLLFNQAFGDHRNLAGTRLRLRWAAFHSSGRRSEPDRRTVVYGPQGGINRLLIRASSGERFYSNLSQEDLGATVSLRMPLWPEAWGTLGAWAQTTERDFGNRRFRMMQASEASPPGDEAFAAPVEELFGPGIGTRTRIADFTREDDSYRAKQVLYSAYAMLETPIVGRLSLAGGVRMEVFEQKVQSFNIFTAQAAASPDQPDKTDRTDTDYLPGANLKYQLTDTMLLRAAYGLTVSRPQTRELAPYLYYDFVRDRNIVGDPNLERTLIHNADLRWEWFFGEGEVIAFSGFYKQFKNPIELVILTTAYDSQFRNAKGATNIGFEGELRLNLSRLNKALRSFNFDANFALIESKIQLRPEDAGSVSSERPLFGQAPYVVNVGLRYFRPESQLSAAVVYNVVGPRITDVGIRINDVILPNIDEQPFHSLDFVGSVQLSDHVRMRLKVRNMLLQTLRLKQRDYLTQRIEPGLSAVLSLAYDF